MAMECSRVVVENVTLLYFWASLDLLRLYALTDEDGIHEDEVRNEFYQGCEKVGDGTENENKFLIILSCRELVC